MPTKLLLSLLILFSSLLALDLNNNLIILNQNIKPESSFLEKIHSKWLNPNRKIDIPTLLILDDEDLYGHWIVQDIFYFEDNSFIDGISVIDSTDFDELIFTFYDDNTMDIWFNYGAYEEIEYNNWYTENDSIYLTDYEQNMEAAWYDINEDNQLVLRLIDTEIFQGYPVHLEYIFNYEGEIDSDCAEEGEYYCESGDFFEQQSCDAEDICFWDDDGCWYNCENDNECDCEGSDDGGDDYGCTDLEACNFDSNAYSEDGSCMYPNDYGWCDCQGNYYDCNGECGGEDLSSCTIMYAESAGFFENSDCTGDLITALPGICVSEYYDYYLILSEDECLEYSGIWLASNACYTPGILDDVTTSEECDENSGFWVNYGYYNSYCMVYEEIPNISEDECIDYDGFWIESEEIVEDGPPNLYFYDDGTFSETCGSDECNLDITPTEEECSNAGGYYESNQYCDYTGQIDEETCNTIGGYWDPYNNWCNTNIDELNCDIIGGNWVSEILCFAEGESICDELGGVWYDALCPVGEYVVENDTLIIDFYDVEGPGDGGQFLLTLGLDNYGNWLNLELNLPDWYGGNCFGFSWINNTNLSINTNHYLFVDKFKLLNSYPNPFNPVTNISYSVPENSKVSIIIYDINGNMIEALYKGNQVIGTYNLSWNADNQPSGLYFIKMTANSFTHTQKLMLVK